MFNVGYFIFVFMIAASLGFSYFLYTENQELLVSHGVLETKLSDAVVKNESLVRTVEALEVETRYAQKAADTLSREKNERKTVTVKEVIKIKKELVHEDCADVSIPNTDARVYYN